MSRYELFQHLVGEEIRKSNPHGKLQVVGDTSTLEDDERLFHIAGELISNCAEKGAEEITLTLTPRLIVVEDNLVHTPEEVEKILENIQQPLPVTNKAIVENGQSIRGFGIFSVRNTLLEIGASLFYEHRDGRIIARVEL
ncbi:MAG TPA: hypothetical protein VN174_00510 [Candidatus Methanoperedens sp.]|nr:hypothetical protein [Candidatus Methanoperedens sp.]